MNKVFQIYIGNPSDFELDCMAKTEEMFDLYMCFSDELPNSFPLSAILKSVERNEKASYLYDLATTETQKSDILRYTFLSEHPDYWYLDCDATLESFPELKGNRPCFAEFRGGADGFVIFGNNNPNVFRLIIDEIYLNERAGVSLARAPYKTVKKQPSLIPKTYFKHKGQ